MPELRTRRRTAQPRNPRLRAFGWFLVACLYAAFAHEIARRFAHLLTPALRPVASRLLFILLLLSGFAAMGASGQGQPAPLAAMGLPPRRGRGREWLLGATLGWAGVVAAVLPGALAGGLLVSTARVSPALAGEILFAVFALLASAFTQELIFRGYPFQRLLEAAGPFTATLVSALVFAVSRAAGALSPATFTCSLLLGFLLTLAYLRTRALWAPWGLHFAWNASMGLLFGLPVTGTAGYSPVFSTYSTAPDWLSGDGYGPEGAGFTILVLLGLLFATTRATRDLRHRWALPEIVGAGIPVDLDAASRRRHEAALGPAPVSSPAPSLVQILPASSPDRKHNETDL